MTSIYQVDVSSMQLKINPLVGVTAMQHPKAGRGWCIVSLAKNIAGEKDFIELEILRQYAKQLGVNDWNFRRWTEWAVLYGMTYRVTRRTGVEGLALISNQNIAEKFGPELQKGTSYVPAQKIFGKDWKAFVFAAFQSRLTNNGEKLVSQKRIAEITGISEQTQRKYNKKAGVKSTKNYAVSNIHASGYAAVLEFGSRKCLFKYWNKNTHQMHLGWRLPDSRVCELFGTNGPKKSLRIVSLFNQTVEQYSASMKALQKVCAKDKVTLGELYVYDRMSNQGNRLWIHTPIS